LQVRRGSARLAGGQVHGDAWFHLGVDRSFHGDLNLAALDLEAITRLSPEVSRPATGRISGRINVEGPDPAQAEKYRGKILLDLTDASLVSVPVFREIDRMLGSASGGLFEDGDLVATIANRHLIVEAFTLNGRLAQLHATGTVGFAGQLDLNVLVNTNQIISQTGEALARLIPGLSDVQSRRDSQATMRVASFLSNRLLKLHVTGTIHNPSINANPGLVVAETAVVFFAGVLKLPLGVLR
jgi:translocation and assembly module TamB